MLRVLWIVEISMNLLLTFVEIFQARKHSKIASLSPLMTKGLRVAFCHLLVLVHCNLKCSKVLGMISLQRTQVIQDVQTLRLSMTYGPLLAYCHLALLSTPLAKFGLFSFNDNPSFFGMCIPFLAVL